MNPELTSRRQNSLSSTRTDCYLACNYGILNPFALSYAQSDGPVSVMQLEQEVARGAAMDYPDLFTSVTDPLERGRMILRDPSVNPIVTDSEDFVALGMLLDEVDTYFDRLEASYSQQISDHSGTLDY